MSQQLIMNWENDGELADFNLPNDIKVETFSQRETALEDWLYIVQFGLTEKLEDEDFYNHCMTDREWYSEDNCYFLVIDGKAVATITVICNRETLQGYIHMVACDADFRGKGLGNLLSALANYVLKHEGMKTAYLTTDDFRIPAIKTYLRYGFKPDLSTEDFKLRWDKIFTEIK